MVKASTKSLILGIIAVVINFLTYFTYPRIFGFEEVTLPQSIGFVIFESTFHFILIGGISYLFFKLSKN